MATITVELKQEASLCLVLNKTPTLHTRIRSDRGNPQSTVMYCIQNIRTRNATNNTCIPYLQLLADAMSRGCSNCEQNFQLASIRHQYCALLARLREGMFSHFSTLYAADSKFCGLKTFRSWQGGASKASGPELRCAVENRPNTIREG